MRLANIGRAAIVAIIWTAPLHADHGHSAAPTHVTTPHAPAGPVTTTHGPSHTTTPHGTSHRHETPTTSNHVAPHHATSHHETEHHEATRHEARRTTTRTSTPPTTTPSTTTTPPSPIATKIQSHPQLAAKVTAMLPSGMTMDQAARGFRNQGQFIAALNASKRLGIPFADLKTAMVTNHNSLGQAIHTVRRNTTTPPPGGTTTTGTTTTGTTTGTTTTGTTTPTNGTSHR